VGAVGRSLVLVVGVRVAGNRNLSRRQNARPSAKVAASGLDVGVVSLAGR
jgi:hypothetical protein